MTLTDDLEMRDTRDLSGLITRRALIDAFVLGEGAGDVQRVYAVVAVHLEVLAGFDDLVVVLPLNHRLCSEEQEDVLKNSLMSH